MKTRVYILNCCDVGVISLSIAEIIPQLMPVFFLRSFIILILLCAGVK